MRILLIIGWLFAGLGGVIWHFGPGQRQLELDTIAETLDRAREAAANCCHDEAIDLYTQVIAELPEGREHELNQVMLEKCKAQMMAAQLPEAREALEEMLVDLRQNPAADRGLVTEVCSTLANAQYYMTWLMRLEGLPETDWRPEIDEARQHYALLLEESASVSDEELVRRFSEDLEASVRLARMDLSELQGLPLPSQ